MNASRNIILVCLSLILMLTASVVYGRPIPDGDKSLPGDPGGDPAKFPPMHTVDQIVHNVGNIVTTVDNWGYIGGYSYYGNPSGQWPRNSGHDYLAEIRYWMGAVTSTGDTVVANSYDDFQAIPLEIANYDDYRMLLSTDTSRYAFDGADTVGFSIGNPAYGWRTWDFDANAWSYAQTFDALATSFVSGGPVSLQDSHYRFNDGAIGVPALGLEITQTCLQWNYQYNEDFMFVILDIHNKSSENYVDFAFGLYIDLDVGGPDGTGENGRLEDLVAFDQSENLAWIYDNVGWDPGWQSSTGMMGTKYIETPGGVGMTAFRTDDWAFLPDNDAGRYAMINSAQYDASLPPTDQFYVQCSRGIYLPSGGTVRVVYALIAGEDEADFRANAAMAQQSYDNYFVGPEPPPTPNLKAQAGSRKVYLSWGNDSETGVDPLSGENDFAGYRLYRSDNQGKTWEFNGHETFVAEYTVRTAGDPIPHSFIDRNLYNGVEYWYALAAFDTGAPPVLPLQSGFGVAGEATNIVSVTPRSDAAGYYDAQTTVEHLYSGPALPSEGVVIPNIFNSELLLGAEYQVVFEDALSATYWHLVNLTTGDTILADQTLVNGMPELYDVAEGLQVVVNNGDREPRSFGQVEFSGPDTTLLVASFYGSAIDIYTGVIWPDLGQVQSDETFRYSYELRVSTDSTIAFWVGDASPSYDYPMKVGYEAWNTTTNQRISLAYFDYPPYDLELQPWEHLVVVDYPYDSTVSVAEFAFPERFVWAFDWDENYYNPQVGDVFRLEGAPLNSPDDAFSFKVDGINTATAVAEMKDISVVPNPYYAHYDAMVETNEGQSVLEFQNLPDKCTIRIYTMAGDLVKTIDHPGSGPSDGGTARWNLLSSNQQQVSSGIYLYHVSSNYGEHLGRFAVVK